jgi:hypothetical protein
MFWYSFLFVAMECILLHIKNVFIATNGLLHM